MCSIKFRRRFLNRYPDFLRDVFGSIIAERVLVRFHLSQFMANLQEARYAGCIIARTLLCFLFFRHMSYIINVGKSIKGPRLLVAEVSNKHCWSVGILYVIRPATRGISRGNLPKKPPPATASQPGALESGITCIARFPYGMLCVLCTHLSSSAARSISSASFSSFMRLPNW